MATKHEINPFIKDGIYDIDNVLDTVAENVTLKEYLNLLIGLMIYFGEEIASLQRSKMEEEG